MTNCLTSTSTPASLLPSANSSAIYGTPLWSSSPISLAAVAMLPARFLRSLYPQKPLRKRNPKQSPATPPNRMTPPPNRKAVVPPPRPLHLKHLLRKSPLPLPGMKRLPKLQSNRKNLLPAQMLNSRRKSLPKRQLNCFKIKTASLLTDWLFF